MMDVFSSIHQSIGYERGAQYPIRVAVNRCSCHRIENPEMKEYNAASGSLKSLEHQRSAHEEAWQQIDLVEERTEHLISY